MGHYSSRTKFVEVFMNEDGGQIGGPASSDYLGVYVLMEKIKRGKDRVDIEELRPTDTAEPEITGGYIIRHDKNRTGSGILWTWAGRWFYVEPSDTEITTPQKNYIKNYIEEFEAVLQRLPVLPTPSMAMPSISMSNHSSTTISVRRSPRRWMRTVYSTYVTKDRGGKLEMSPEWDYNWSMGNNYYVGFGATTVHLTSGWHREAGLWEYRWHARLREDPEYRLKYADRWFHLRETVLSDAAIAQTMDAHYRTAGCGGGRPELFPMGHPELVRGILLGLATRAELLLRRQPRSSMLLCRSHLRDAGGMVEELADRHGNPFRLLCGPGLCASICRPARLDR